MQLTVKVEGEAATRAALKGEVAKFREAISGALNRTSSGIRFDINRAMQSTFHGGATSYTLRAFEITKSTPSNLQAEIKLRTDSPAKGRAWNKSLEHLFTGGVRAWKRSEGAFRRIGALPDGMMMVPGGACPLDSYGNPKPSFIAQLISYFGGFGEQGYRANMKDRRRSKLANKGKTVTGYRTINGVEYFISYGRQGKPGGDRYIHGRFDQHLAPGIWSRSGIHGAVVKPVFLFVRAGHWSQTINLQDVAKRTIGRVWSANLNTAMKLIA